MTERSFLPRVDRLAGLLVLVALIPSAACDPPSGPSLSAPAPPRVATPDASAQELDPLLADAWRSTQTGLPEETRAAVEEYRRQRGGDANPGQCEFVLGMSYQRRQLYQEASRHFTRAIEVQPGFFEAYYYQGIALQNLGRLADARKALAIYAAYQPDEENTAFQQGLVELEDDQIDAAERFFRKAIEIAERKARGVKDPRAFDGDLGKFWTRLGDVCARRDESAQAREMYEQASKLQPGIPDIWHKLATACERLGDAEAVQRARLEFERVSALRARPMGVPR